jgi:hypothetical protein
MNTLSNLGIRRYSMIQYYYQTCSNLVYVPVIIQYSMYVRVCMIFITLLLIGGRPQRTESRVDQKKINQQRMSPITNN